MQTRQVLLLIENQLQDTAHLCGGNVVTLRSKKQSVVVRSNVETEFRVMAQGACEILWLKRVLDELKKPINLPMKLYCDNKATIIIVHNPIMHDRTKYIEIDKCFIKEKLVDRTICTRFIPTTLQVVDVLTKGLSRPLFETQVSKYRSRRSIYSSSAPYYGVIEENSGLVTHAAGDLYLQEDIEKLREILSWESNVDKGPTACLDLFGPLSQPPPASPCLPISTTSSGDFGLGKKLLAHSGSLAVSATEIPVGCCCGLSLLPITTSPS
ncbi:hypothetical protein ZIOFF_031853 [Zingiber officinale]|uniref:Uncharacterized protein n=1 Tax=Zingiber officinale TaxID=94328 RepID=A0A8J5GUG5_ZINOF|nr:hypothetical protein ZIOFF_031853 [Zingiber officinale]